MTYRISDTHALDLNDLIAMQQPPAPWTPGEPLFWDDPHISAQMLAAHLDPTIDAASCRPEIIDRSVAWLIQTLGLAPGDSVLDLGCGPGLYATRLAECGLTVTGIDVSRRSIAYAQQQAAIRELPITYRCEDYLELEDHDAYDAVLLIYGDFCVLSPYQRNCLLAHVRRALRPDGRFALDVSTREHRHRHALKNRWYAADGGFWRSGPHLVLEQGFDYPNTLLHLDQFIVIEAAGTITVYRNWFQEYTIGSISTELRAAGLEITGLWSDLAGAPLTGDSEWIGIIAQPVELPPDDLFTP